MRATVTVTWEREFDELPSSCSVCPFSDLCAAVMPFRLTKNGVDWTKAAMTRRHSKCPMRVED